MRLRRTPILVPNGPVKNAADEDLIARIGQFLDADRRQFGRYFQPFGQFGRDSAVNGGND